MKNKQAHISVLIPFFAVTLIAVILLVTGIIIIDWSQETHPVVGEKQQAIFDAYSQANALRIYAEQAAKQAVAQASNTNTLYELDQAIIDEYAQLLAAYQQYPIYATPQLIREQRTITLTIPEPVRIPISYGEELLQERVRSGAVFTQWPTRNRKAITSIFGQRDLPTSPNHAGIDIRAAIGDDVLSVDAGEITKVTFNSVTVRMDNGYTCEYVHVGHLSRQGVGVGTRVARGDVIARVIKDRDYDPHLDFRCYNHEQPLSNQQAKQLFGEQHVGGRTSPPPDTTYIVVEPAFQPDPERSYIDPYCLFSEDIQQAAYNILKTDDQLRTFNSGLYKYPRGHVSSYSDETLRDQLTATCNAYIQQGLIGTQPDTAQQYLQAALELIIENEGVTRCTDHQTSQGGPTNYGVTIDSLAAYENIPLAQARDNICQLTREQAEQVLVTYFLQQPNFDELPAELIPHVWDMSVDHTPTNAAKLLREVLVEGEFLTEATSPHIPLSEETIQAAETAISTDEGFYEALVERRILFYQEIVANNPSQQDSLQEWLNRAEKYRAPISFSTQHAQGTYRFMLSANTQMSAETYQQMRERTQHHDRLHSSCDYRDTVCSQSILAGSGFAVCAQPQIQIPHLLEGTNGCATQLRSGCSCQAPLQVLTSDEHNISFGKYTLHVDEQQIPLYWIDDLGEDEHLFLAVQDGEELREVYLFNHTTGPLRYVHVHPGGQVGGEYELQPISNTLYLHANLTNAGPVIVFSQTNQSALCEQTIKQTYCHENQLLTVEHPLGLP